MLLPRLAEQNYHLPRLSLESSLNSVATHLRLCIPQLTSLEICSGAGRQALGLEMAGFGHLALVEIRPPASSPCDKNGHIGMLLRATYILLTEEAVLYNGLKREHERPQQLR